MNTFRARRATTDDLSQLMDLWEAEHLPAQELEKHFTEFQIVEDGNGSVLAAIGLHISGGEGKIYGETFLDFAQTDELRPILWERLQLILPNYGLFRVWIEETAPFWKKSAGFTEPSRELLPKLPPAFGAIHPGWLMLKLKDEAASHESIDRTFAMFKEMERTKTEQAIQRAKTIKIICTILVALLFLLAICSAAFIFRRLPAHR